MTKLTPETILTRETAAQEGGRPLVVELHPRYLAVRLKGLREAHNVDYETLLAFARRRAFESEHRIGVPAKRKGKR